MSTCIKEKNALSKSISRVVLAGSLMMSQVVFSHGYVSQPESRSFKCKLGDNSHCGPVQYEPQSVEGPDRFPETGPEDGQLASAGISRFSQLNEQTATRWAKTLIKPGQNNFSWHFTANHVTRDFRYYITKNGWNQNQPLSRNSLQLQPFCSYDGNQQRPPINLTHSCEVPADRSGYHVILAVWDVGDTAASFYQAVDVIVDNETDPGPVDSYTDVGDINPALDLNIGDSVKTRVFNALGEINGLTTEIVIETIQQGEKNTWPLLFAQAINREQTDIAAGRLDANGNITPTYGKNEIYAKDSSDITRVEVAIEQVQPPAHDISISGLNDEYSIHDNQVAISFTLDAIGELDIEYSIFDASNTQLAFGTLSLADGSELINLTLDQAQPGSHSLVVKAKPKSGNLLQKTQAFTIVNDGGHSGEYDFVFPDGLASYQAGTRVLQPKDAKVYRCKPFPFSGYCAQWSEGSTQFEPGTGSHWTQAWELQ